MRPRSLRAIMAIYATVFLGALIVQRAVNYSVAHEALVHEVDLRIADEATQIVNVGRNGGLVAMAAYIKAAERDHDTADLLYLLVDRSGRRLAGNLALGAMPPPGLSDFGQEADVAGVAHGRALTRRIADGATLVVVSDNDEVDRFNRLMFRVQLAGLIVTALIFLGGAVGITLVIRSRMKAMQKTVDAVIGGNLRSRVPLDGTRSEFDQLAGAFNLMLDRIDDLMSNIRHAAKDVTHELKTPLAALRAKIAATLRHARANPLEDDLADILGQTDAILDLFASLLRLWEVEGGQRRERFAAIDITAMAMEVGEAMAPVAEDADQRLVVIPGPPLTVRGEANLLRQMIVNLAENALRHTPPGTAVTLQTEQRGNDALVIVADNGPGIPADAHEHVVRRFGRLSSARETPGQGLGLTLVDAIARLHQGQLTLADAAPGVRAVVSLPLGVIA